MLKALARRAVLVVLRLVAVAGAGFLALVIFALCARSPDAADVTPQSSVIPSAGGAPSVQERPTVSPTLIAAMTDAIAVPTTTLPPTATPRSSPVQSWGGEPVPLERIPAPTLAPVPITPVPALPSPTPYPTQRLGALPASEDELVAVAVDLYRCWLDEPEWLADTRSVYVAWLQSRKGMTEAEATYWFDRWTGSELLFVEQSKWMHGESIGFFHMLAEEGKTCRWYQRERARERTPTPAGPSL